MIFTLGIGIQKPYRLQPRTVFPTGKTVRGCGRRSVSGCSAILSQIGAGMTEPDEKSASETGNRKSKGKSMKSKAGIDAEPDFSVLSAWMNRMKWKIKEYRIGKKI